MDNKAHVVTTLDPQVRRGGRATGASSRPTATPSCSWTKATARNYSDQHARMRLALKGACFIAFTGTPLAKSAQEEHFRPVRRPVPAGLHHRAGRGRQGRRAPAVRGPACPAAGGAGGDRQLVREADPRADRGTEGRPEAEVLQRAPTEQGGSEGADDRVGRQRCTTSRPTRAPASRASWWPPTRRRPSCTRNSWTSSARSRPKS